ncbi:MAG TPA: S9 family peptidase [Aldersonia sp.]
MQPPVAKRVPRQRTHHDDTFVDEYEWLRDKDDPEVVAYLEAENAYTREQTAHLQPLQDAIFAEIKSRTKETDLSVPVRMGEFWYYSRSFEGKQYGMQCRCPIAGPDDWTPPDLEAEGEVAGEQVLLDGNELAEGHEFFSLGAFSVSHDGTLLAYSTDVVGDERYTLRIKDLRTGEVLPDEIPKTAPGATWALDHTHLFYLTVDDSWRPDTVWRHKLGTPADADVQVFREPDERYWVGIGSTRSERYLMIWIGSKITSEGWMLESDNPEGEFRIILPRQEGVEYSVEHAVIGGQDRFLVLHNGINTDGIIGGGVLGDGGQKPENFVLAEAPVDDPTNLTTLIPHDPAVRLEDVDAFADHLVLSYRREALPRAALWPLTDTGYGARRELEFDLELYSVGLGANPEWRSPMLRLGMGSFITPAQIFDLDLATGELLLRKEQPVLGEFDANDYEQHRDWAIADDGTRIPISLVSRKGVQRPAPLLLYGYGSYEASMDPSFSVARLSLLDRGMIFALAHVRGGGELGRYWYEQGKTLTKANTFTDFVACGRHLVDTGVTTPDRMVAEGGSAGGLLMGAVANLAPDLFAGIEANVPFVDPLTSILDPSLPLTVIEWDEWGNPLADKEVYEYMKGYSPYENVEAKNYPPILAITSINDTRVLYVEPAKWVARLRATKTGDAPLLLKTEMSAGHGGVSGRYHKWKEVAFEFAWLLDIAGIPG